jgi:hypothetical protein
VDTGAARQGWANNIDEANGDQPIVIENNVPYIGMLEYGGYSTDSKTGKTVNGYSRQAPHGMVGVTMANANQMFEKAAKAAGGGS